MPRWTGAKRVVEIAGERVTVQVFYMRLCYSRKLFMMAFPAQKQEAFFEGHVQAFHHFRGVPHRITYDNLKAAVQKVLEGHTRQEQQAFIAFRSHYLFESHFCTPGQGNEKGGVEHGVGFGRRNFMVPIPKVASFAELNALLLAECLEDDERQVDGQPVTIGEAWELERPALLPLPGKDFECCVTRPVCLTPYSQVEFETNRYSVPADKAQPHLVLKAYPFRVDILYLEEVIASHAALLRQRNQDIFDPLHYLPLLEQRPGAFQHAKPLRRWRETWPPAYERLLAKLQAEQVSRACASSCASSSCMRSIRPTWSSRRSHKPWSTAASMPMASSCACASCCDPRQRRRRWTWPGIRGWLAIWSRRTCAATSSCWWQGGEHGSQPAPGELPQDAAPARLSAQLPQVRRGCRPGQPELRPLPAVAGRTGDRPAREEPPGPADQGRPLPGAQGTGRLRLHAACPA